MACSLLPQQDPIFNQARLARRARASQHNSCCLCSASPCLPAFPARHPLVTGSEIDMQAEQPSFTFPLLNSVDAVHVSEEMPAAIGAAITHDTSLFDGASNPVSFYRQPANRAGKSFTPGVWWTFVSRERSNHAASNGIVGARWINVASITNGQPLQ